jgi:ferredoxin
VPGEKKKKIIKTIRIDVDKCHGCRACEMICSAFHAEPKYSSNNPARARIRLIRDPLKDVYVPVYAGDYAPAECAGRDKYTIDGKEYDECAFCRSSCPSRDEFKEPDSGLPLKCVVHSRCSGIRRKGRGSRRRGRAGGVGDRIGITGRQIRIAEDVGYYCTNVKERLKVVTKPHLIPNICVADLLKMLTYTHVCCAFSSARALIFGAI